MKHVTIKYINLRYNSDMSLERIRKFSQDVLHSIGMIFRLYHFYTFVKTIAVMGKIFYCSHVY
jgi:hypothetical protein